MGVPAPHPALARSVTGRAIPVGNHESVLRGGNSVVRRQDGRITDVHDVKRGMDIHHAPDGRIARVSVMRADHSRIVVERGRAGFVERPYSFRGHDFDRRTYAYHGQVYQRFYRGYSFHGVAIQVYAPARYYSVGFYGWAYHPWARPIVYSWGWGPSPWYGYYGYYFTPYPAYDSASLWLTDYMISNDLQSAYEAGQESASQNPAPQAGDPSFAMTPQVKQMIANEVQSQIALENAEAQQNSQNQDPDPASSGIARMLGDGGNHVFVVGAPLDLVDSSGAECSVSEGDALQLAAPPAPTDQAASLIVLSSKSHNECARTSTVTVALDDLQEMQNHMREAIDRGMEQLQQQQGKGGLPTAPPSATAAPTTMAFAQLAPPPDPNTANDINQQLQAANQSEQDVTAQANLPQ